MQLSDFFINPSHSEGLPRSILEAAAAGLPIVASDVGGTIEIISHEKSGLIFQPDQKQDMEGYLHRLLENGDLCDQLGNAARKRVDTDFSWHTILRSYVDLFHEVVQ
jgi:glycosyltransferase involved in cell wall biosynthesis